MFSNDDRLAQPLMESLRKMHGFIVGDNEPYSGVTLGYCLKLHGLAQGLPHAQVEIRQDLICTEAGQKWWADTLAAMLAPILELDDLKQVKHH
jgi:predicted N-formylglutamate amidohydrolase